MSAPGVERTSRDVLGDRWTALIELCAVRGLMWSAAGQPATHFSDQVAMVSVHAIVPTSESVVVHVTRRRMVDALDAILAELGPSHE